jgi:N-acetylglutamate synthase-like GNAT family acetyltransferase
VLAAGKGERLRARWGAPLADTRFRLIDPADQIADNIDHMSRAKSDLSVTFRPATRADYEQVRRLLIDVGWERRVAEQKRFERMMEGASRTVVAVENARVVGFARALFDGASNGYISTVAVAVDRQGQGIGRQMVQRLMAVDDPDTITWVLRAGRGSEPFWRKMGFGKSETAMEIVRKS